MAASGLSVFMRCFLAVATALFCLSGEAGAQVTHTKDGVRLERRVPSIWIDPDGCEHWTMDDGWEGYMTPNVTPDGIPVCHRGNPCLVENSDQLFATGRHVISPANRQRLLAFFRSATATSFVIDGHTDPRGGFEYNMRLSERRANAVAQIAREAGVRISKVRGWGPTQPIASNRTAEGMARNRRVEVFCIR